MPPPPPPLLLCLLPLLRLRLPLLVRWPSIVACSLFACLPATQPITYRSSSDGEDSGSAAKIPSDGGASSSLITVVWSIPSIADEVSTIMAPLLFLSHSAPNLRPCASNRPRWPFRTSFLYLLGAAVNGQRGKPLRGREPVLSDLANSTDERGDRRTDR